jgi:hypothetical protein
LGIAGCTIEPCLLFPIFCRAIALVLVGLSLSHLSQTFGERLTLFAVSDYQDPKIRARVNPAVD